MKKIDQIKKLSSANIKSTRIAGVMILIFFANITLAQGFIVSGTVKDSLGFPFSGADVQTIDPDTQIIVNSNLTDSSGYYTSNVQSGTYNIKVVPPLGSGFVNTTVLNRVINSDTTINFILTPIGTINLSGRLLDPLGNGISSQNVDLTPSGGTTIYGHTDGSGSYSFGVTPGSYNVHASNNHIHGNTYWVDSNSFSINGDTNMDLKPFKRLTIHVQDSSGNPVNNVGISTNHPCNPVIWGNVPASGCSSYEQGRMVTDTSGNAELWLIPTTTNNYTITATPPTGSGFAITISSNVNFNNDKTVTIVLATPIYLSGRLLDPLGNGISGQPIALTISGGNTIYQNTDTSGSYSFGVTPGSYNLQAGGSGAIGGYWIQSNSFSINGNTNMDLKPFKRVTVHVQDSSGNPINNVDISTNHPCNPINWGNVPASGCSMYVSGVIATGTSGNAELWLIPTATNNYTITATPPTGSGFNIFSINDINIISDETIIMSLQFVQSSCGGNTPKGQNIETGPASNINVKFDVVSQCGNTSVFTYPSNQWNPIPNNYQGVSFNDIQTNAIYSNNIMVSITYSDSDISDIDEGSIKMFHLENGNWVDVTTSLDIINNKVTGTVNSLSPFTIAGTLSGTVTPTVSPTVTPTVSPTVTPTTRNIVRGISLNIGNIIILIICLISVSILRIRKR